MTLNPIPPACVSSVYLWASRCNSVGFHPIQKRLRLGCIAALPRWSRKGTCGPVPGGRPASLGLALLRKRPWPRFLPEPRCWLGLPIRLEVDRHSQRLSLWWRVDRSPPACHVVAGPGPYWTGVDYIKQRNTHTHYLQPVLEAESRTILGLYKVGFNTHTHAHGDLPSSRRQPRRTWISPMILRPLAASRGQVMVSFHQNGELNGRAGSLPDACSSSSSCFAMSSRSTKSKCHKRKNAHGETANVHEKYSQKKS